MSPKTRVRLPPIGISAELGAAKPHTGLLDTLKADVRNAATLPLTDVPAALDAVDAETIHLQSQLVRLATLRGVLVARFTASPPPVEAPKWLTTDDVGARLQKSESTLLRMLRRGNFPGAVKMGGEWRIPPQAVEAYERNLSAC